MPKRKLKHSMFTWVDLVTPDPVSAAAFYHRLFGWSTRPFDAEHPGAYTLFVDDDEPVAGLARMPAESPGANTPAFWLSYILVDDIDETVRSAESLGARVRVGPNRVGEAGRMAMIEDPTGAAVCLWEAGTFRGGAAFGSPGRHARSELLTRDPEAAVSFFTELFGWRWRRRELPGIGTYHICMVGDRPNGAIMRMPEQVPDDVPPHWEVYFGSADVDASVARVREAGGRILMPARDIPVGRFAFVADPGGARFSLFRPSPPTE